MRLHPLHCESIGMNERKNKNTMDGWKWDQQQINELSVMHTIRLLFVHSFAFSSLSIWISVHPKDFSYKNKVKLLHSIHLVFENHWSNMIRYKFLLFLIVSIDWVLTKLYWIEFRQIFDNYCVHIFFVLVERAEKEDKPYLD